MKIRGEIKGKGKRIRERGMRGEREGESERRDRDVWIIGKMRKQEMRRGKGGRRQRGDGIFPRTEGGTNQGRGKRRIEGKEEKGRGGEREERGKSQIYPEL